MMTQAPKLTRTHRRLPTLDVSRRSSAVLAPWVEYLKRLPESERYVMLHDLKVVVGVEV